MNVNNMTIPTAAENAREFDRRRNLPFVTVKYICSKRSTDLTLSRCGVELGSKTEFTTRGKVTSTTYILPKVDGV